MPAYLDSTGRVPNPGTAYNNDAKDGVEIDIYEHEYFSEHRGGSEKFNNILYMKVIGGAVGNTQNEITSAPIGFEYNDSNKTAVIVKRDAPQGRIGDGWHKVGLLWTENELIWFVDGVAVVKDISRVPNCPMYMILSREMNTGVKDPRQGGYDPTQDAASQLPNRPPDPGLQSRNVATARNLEQLADTSNPVLQKDGQYLDHVRVNYVKVWSVSVENPGHSVRGTRYGADNGEIFWDKSGYSEFNIYRNNIKVNSEANTGSSYYDETLAVNTEYTFEVRAIVTSGEKSLGSVQIPGQPGQATPLALPVATTPIVATLESVAPANTETSSTNTTVGDSEIRIINRAEKGLEVVWNTGQWERFNVYVDSIRLNNTAISGFNYIIANLSPGRTYKVEVRALSGTGEIILGDSTVRV